MRQTHVPHNVTRLQGAHCYPKLPLRCTDFRAPENLILPVLIF